MSRPSQHTTPTLAFFGITGAGKSSLVNALVKADVQRVGVNATTREPAAQPLETPSHVNVTLLDTPGIGEAGTDEAYRKDLLALLPELQVLVWVVGYDSRALDNDVRFLNSVREAAPDLPLLVLGSRVDLVSRSFTPETFDPENGTSPNEEKIRDWLTYLKETFAFANPRAVRPCAAGENAMDKAHQFNLNAVAEAIEEALPEAARVNWLRFERVERNRGEKAHKIILAGTGAAGLIGLTPLPVADMPFIVTTQVAMILGLCATYERPLSQDTAKSLALAALSAVAGPMIFQTLTKLIPFMGSVIGAGVAGACTWAVGQVTKQILESGDEFNVESFKKAVRRLYDEKRNSK